MSQSECSACGLFFGVGVHYRNVRTTNGGLLLCQQCLDDINRKNPELIAMKKENQRLKELEASYEDETFPGPAVNLDW